jgi:hypothetical protein
MKEFRVRRTAMADEITSLMESLHQVLATCISRVMQLPFVICA